MFTLSDVFQSRDWHQLLLQHHSASDYGFHLNCSQHPVYPVDWKAVFMDNIKLSFKFVQWTVGDFNKEESNQPDWYCVVNSCLAH